MAVETPRCSGVRKQPVLAERTGLLRSVQWTTLCAIETKRSTGHRLSAEVKRLLALLAQKLSISQTAVLELAFHEKAKREGVK